MSLRSLLVPAALAGALALPITACAQSSQAAPQQQQGWSEGQHHHHGGAWMRVLRGLNLSADQQSRIKSIMTSFRSQYQNGNRPDANARKQMRDQVLAVLTPAQRTAFDAKMKELAAQRAKNGGGWSNGGGGR